MHFLENRRKHERLSFNNGNIRVLNQWSNYSENHNSFFWGIWKNPKIAMKNSTLMGFNCTRLNVIEYCTSARFCTVEQTFLGVLKDECLLSCVRPQKKTSLGLKGVVWLKLSVGNSRTCIVPWKSRLVILGRVTYLYTRWIMAEQCWMEILLNSTYLHRDLCYLIGCVKPSIASY